MRCAGRPALYAPDASGYFESRASPKGGRSMNLNRQVRPLQVFSTESLILAQNERWRHGLGMQVGRDAAMHPVAKGCATREEPAPGSWISAGNGV